ncbi:hoc head outer capsid protein [Escherichia phage JS10]|uniref:Hoc head outer capsid protein n=1 Tax=Escherichia phage JS10 TaxID=576790 RepID=C4MZS2_9CAUD|nr:Hoc-like head decoration [Escherichia phage JS10]ACL78403.1 hoc head outer capsid protein [Escherichia phage JS10]
MSIQVNGPHYELVGRTVTLRAVLSESLTDADIKWYKNGVNVPLLDKEDPMYLNLWDVGFPASGTYYAIATDKLTQEVFQSDDFVLEIGMEPRDIVISVENLDAIVKAAIGQKVSLQPLISMGATPWAEVECEWWKYDKMVSNVKDLDVDINPSMYGTYSLNVSATAEGAYNPYHDIVTVDIMPLDGILPEPEVCPFIYSNDLNQYLSYPGGRNRAHMWIGWWVLDEIKGALAKDQDWAINIEDSNFRYKCELMKVAELLSRYPDVEIQESRNGYILNRKHLTLNVI